VHKTEGLVDQRSRSAVLPSTVFAPMPETIPERWCGGFEGIPGGKVTRVRFNHSSSVSARATAQLSGRVHRLSGGGSDRLIKGLLWHQQKIEQGRLLAVSGGRRRSCPGRAPRAPGAASLSAGKDLVAREFSTGSSVVQRIKVEAVGAPGCNQFPAPAGAACFPAAAVSRLRGAAPRRALVGTHAQGTVGALRVQIRGA